MDLITLIISIMTILILGGCIFQDAEVYPFGQKKIELFGRFNDCLCVNQYSWTVKFIIENLYLLNVVTFINAQKTTKSTLIYTKNHSFRG
ncbi:hypothetical protein [Falsiporphyromonas endometrii]|uniref:Uncharacterized protein n=1 Tax=Falsiporphyromonas endometrii TaxID=1387297 RepID=A0ABV9K5U3_9PORP